MKRHRSTVGGPSGNQVCPVRTVPVDGGEGVYHGKVSAVIVYLKETDSDSRKSFRRFVKETGCLLEDIKGGKVVIDHTGAEIPHAFQVTGVPFKLMVVTDHWNVLKTHNVIDASVPNPFAAEPGTQYDKELKRSVRVQPFHVPHLASAATKRRILESKLPPEEQTALSEEAVSLAKKREKEDRTAREKKRKAAAETAGLPYRKHIWVNMPGSRFQVKVTEAFAKKLKEAASK